MRRGFTLIEVLLALAVTAVVLASLYGAFFAIRTGATATEGSLVRLHEARTTLDAIRREVESAFMPKEFELAAWERYGQPATEATFVTHGSVLPGPARVRYTAREDEQGQESMVLVKEVVPLGTDIGDSARETVMVEGVSEFRIEALEGKEDKWTATWRERELPERVRITIEFQAGQRTVRLADTALLRLGRQQ